MKKLGFRSIAALAAGVVLLAASCSKADDGANQIALPVLTDIPAAPAGTTGEIKFTAPDTWEMSSDAMWLILSPATGPAGEAKVNYTINYKAQNFTSNQTANVTLVTAGQTIPFKVTREAKPRTMTFTNDEGVAGVTYAIEQDANNTNLYRTKFKVTANFDWKITAIPDWIEIAEDFLEGEAGATYTIWCAANPAQLEDIAMSGKMIFKDKNTPSASISTASEVTLTYIGADDSFAVVNGFEDSKFKVEFDKNGMLKTNGEDGINFSVLAKPGYAMYFIQIDPKWGATILDKWSSWAGTTNLRDARATIPSDNYQLWAQLNDGLARELLFYILPKSAVEELGGNPDNMFQFEGDYASVKPEYEKYYTVKIAQDGAGAGFTLGNKWGQGGDGASMTKVENPDPSYGTDVVYRLTVDNETTYNTIGLSAFDYATKGLSLGFSPAEQEKDFVTSYEVSLGEYGSNIEFKWKKNATAADKTITINVYQAAADPETKRSSEAPEIFGVIVLTIKGTGN